MNKPSDIKVRQAIEAIFNLDSGGNGLSRAGTELKSRTLLRHWPLSRVERLSFRSEQLPSLILKAVTAPLMGELAVYEDLFSGVNSDTRRWTPTLYGHQYSNDDLWLILEDVGPRLLKNEPTLENLSRTITALAGMHVQYGREVINGTLQARSHLTVRDYEAYINGAKQTLVMIRALVNKNLFTSVTEGQLSKLEAIVDMYDRVAMGLVSAPQTLVHGDFHADNIALSENGDRIYMLDWADAHIGAGLVDMVDLVDFATAEFGREILPKMLQNYRSSYRASSGEPLATEPLEEIFVCCQIEKKISMIHWFCQCSLKWIPSGVDAYNFMVGGQIEEAYKLSTILV